MFIGNFVDVNGTNHGRPGLFSEGTGTLAEVVRIGQQAPGADPGVVISSFFHRPQLNASGQIAFAAQLAGAGVDDTNDYAIYSNGSGAMAEIARIGDFAPGTQQGTRFIDIQSPFVFNDLGKVAFLAGLSGPESINSAIYSGDAGNLFPVARKFTGQVVGAPSGTRFVLFSNLTFNDIGQVVFFAQLTGPNIADPNTGIYTGRDANDLAEVIRSGVLRAPGGFPSDFKLSIFSNYVVNSHGDVAFVGFVGPSGVNNITERAIYRENSGLFELVARKGESAEGLGPGVVMTFFYDPGLADNGQTAFRANISGPEVDGRIPTAIVTGEPDSLTSLAYVGQQVPGAEDGVFFSSLSDPTITTRGQVVFTAGLFGEDIDGTNNLAIYATDIDGNLNEILRRGQLLDVSDNPQIEDLRTVSNFSIILDSTTTSGGTSSISDLGHIAFLAIFTDGSSGIFVSDKVAVPEPSSFLVATFCTLLLHRRRRH